MPTLVQQLHATRGSRINHYPLGVHGPYLASPWAAARLGQRVFTTKAEYQWRVREDYDPAGRHRLAAVAARIAEREAADALQASTRYRQAIWNGEDPDASGYAQPRVEIRKRHARVEPDGRTGHGVKRCIRTPEEEQEVMWDITAFMEIPVAAEIQPVVAEETFTPEVKTEVVEGEIAPLEERLPTVKHEAYDEQLTFPSFVEAQPLVTDEVPTEEEIVAATVVVEKMVDAQEPPAAIKIESYPSMEVVSTEEVLDIVRVEDISMDVSASLFVSSVSVDEDIIMGEAAATQEAALDRAIKAEDEDAAIAPMPLRAALVGEETLDIVVRVEEISVCLDAIPPLPATSIDEDLIMGEEALTLAIPDNAVKLEDEDLAVLSAAVCAPSMSIAMDVDVPESHTRSELVDEDVPMSESRPATQVKVEESVDGLPPALEAAPAPPKHIKLEAAEVPGPLSALDVNVHPLPFASVPSSREVDPESEGAELVVVKAEDEEHVSMVSYADFMAGVPEEEDIDDAFAGELSFQDDLAHIPEGESFLPALASPSVKAESTASLESLFEEDLHSLPSLLTGASSSREFDLESDDASRLAVEGGAEDWSESYVDCVSFAEDDDGGCSEEVVERPSEEDGDWTFEVVNEGDCSFVALEDSSSVVQFIGAYIDDDDDSTKTDSPAGMHEGEGDEHTEMPGGWPMFKASPTKVAEEGDCLAESESAASFMTAAETHSENIAHLSTLHTGNSLCTPGPVPSPSILCVLDEFACTPTLVPRPFEDNANLWPLSRPMSSEDLLGLSVEDEEEVLSVAAGSPEFASNFAQTQFSDLFYPSSPFSPIAARDSHYASVDAFFEEHLGDEGPAADEREEAKFGLYPDMSQQYFECATPYMTALDFFDGPFGLVRDDEAEEECGSDPEATCVSSPERADETFDHEVAKRSESPVVPASPASSSVTVVESPRLAFEDVWECARAQAFTEKVIADRISEYERKIADAFVEKVVDDIRSEYETRAELELALPSSTSVDVVPDSEETPCGEHEEERIDGFQSLYEEIDDLLELFAPSESTADICPPLSTEEEEFQMETRPANQIKTVAGLRLRKDKDIDEIVELYGLSESTADICRPLPTEAGEFDMEAFPAAESEAEPVEGACLYEEIDEILELFGASESATSVLPPAPVGAEGDLTVSASVHDISAIQVGELEEIRVFATIRLTAAGPYAERLEKAARETFWWNWTRPSGEDLAAIFKRRDDAALPQSSRIDEFSTATKPLHRALSVRQRLKQEARDLFLDHWEQSMAQLEL